MILWESVSRAFASWAKIRGFDIRSVLQQIGRSLTTRRVPQIWSQQAYVSVVYSCVDKNTPSEILLSRLRSTILVKEKIWSPLHKPACFRSCRLTTTREKYFLISLRGRPSCITESEKNAHQKSQISSEISDVSRVYTVVVYIPQLISRHRN